MFVFLIFLLRNGEKNLNILSVCPKYDIQIVKNFHHLIGYSNENNPDILSTIVYIYQDFQMVPMF